MKRKISMLALSSLGLVFIHECPAVTAPNPQPLILAQKNSVTQPLPISQQPNVLFPNPEIIIRSNGNPGHPTITQEDSRFVGKPPTQNNPITLPRAEAPPVGDMAVSNLQYKPEYINLGTGRIIPRMVIRQAPVREILEALAHYAGLNFVFLDTQSNTVSTDQSSNTSQASTNGTSSNSNTQANSSIAQGDVLVSLDLTNEPVEEVFNSVLQISNYHANRRGNTIFVGSTLPDGARNIVSRTIRLNQVKVQPAGTFLAGQGAYYQVSVTATISNLATNSSSLGNSAGSSTGSSNTSGNSSTTSSTNSNQSTSSSSTKTSSGSDLSSQSGIARPLKGLTVVTDDRLNTITLTGEPRLVELATAYLTRLDARVRQVAVNVKVIDISLANTTEINASSAFRFSNNQYFISNSGSAFLNFGSNSTNAPLPGGFAVPPYGFLLSVQAQITNGNAKILTDPTLIVQENQQATVNMTQQVLTSITCTNSTTSTSTSNGTNSSLITCTPVFSNAGLTLTVNVDKIDDNGYISLSVAPTIAAPYSTVVYNSGAVGANNTFTLLDTRSLTSGLIRLRDAQTLVLSGIITSSDKTTISKVPILGDIPLLGALFRKTNSENNRGELIILLTPHILNEQNDNQLGEGYSPTPKAAEELKQQAFPWTK